MGKGNDIPSTFSFKADMSLITKVAHIYSYCYKYSSYIHFSSNGSVKNNFI